MSISVIIEDLDDHPICPHGPTLLFSKQNQEFFACSACRDRKECSFYLRKRDFNSKRAQTTVIDVNKNYEEHLQLYNSSLTIRKTPSTKYCIDCNNFFLDPSLHKSHKIIKVDDKLLQYPNQFLKPNSNDKKEAQYFFTETTLEQFLRIFNKNNLRKIICMGAPRLFEFIRGQPVYEAILLDIDLRLRNFFSPDEFLLYNMFNNFFFCGQQSENSFKKLLNLESKESGMCLIVDPPFGCRTEPLVQTLKTIQRQFYEINKRILPVIWIFPYFMENYITNEMPELIMMDYKVNYTNHDSYKEGGRKLGSPIRMFTNILPNLMEFEGDYKFCKKCDRFVASENNHCEKCKTCPSKNGSTYKHCFKCALCVKPYYIHCDNCHRCIQNVDHNCERYQENVRCYVCGKYGHVERNCKLKTNSPHVDKKGENRVCLICGKIGHNEMNCRNKRKRIEL